MTQQIQYKRSVIPTHTEPRQMSEQHSHTSEVWTQKRRLLEIKYLSVCIVSSLSIHGNRAAGPQRTQCFKIGRRSKTHTHTSNSVSAEVFAGGSPDLVIVCSAHPLLSSPLPHFSLPCHLGSFPFSLSSPPCPVSPTFSRLFFIFLTSLSSRTFEALKRLLNKSTQPPSAMLTYHKHLWKDRALHLMEGHILDSEFLEAVMQKQKNVLPLFSFLPTLNPLCLG